MPSRARTPPGTCGSCAAVPACAFETTIRKKLRPITNVKINSWNRDMLASPLFSLINRSRLISPLAISQRITSAKSPTTPHTRYPMTSSSEYDISLTSSKDRLRLAQERSAQFAAQIHEVTAPEEQNPALGHHGEPDGIPQYLRQKLRGRAQREKQQLDAFCTEVLRAISFAPEEQPAGIDLPGEQLDD